MTLEDKVALCSGASFWETKKYEEYGIDALFLSDGPHGLRKQEDKDDMLGIMQKYDFLRNGQNFTFNSKTVSNRLFSVSLILCKSAIHDWLSKNLCPNAKKSKPLLQYGVGCRYVCNGF